ncbi:hypothetical protein BKA70DRAFT_1421479 [Coprinopsis sp. MPI-PUGE-AT-0042]|nr:hypothetical protein BKA70DRAFT_1421479 [Coprinopsis sp. MPI-PUGE-AT-0042]
MSALRPSFLEACRRIISASPLVRLVSHPPPGCRITTGICNSTLGQWLATTAPYQHLFHSGILATGSGIKPEEPTVSCPFPVNLPKPHKVDQSKIRTSHTSIKRDLKSKKSFAKEFVECATHIVVDLDLEDLPSKKPSPARMAQLERICNKDLGPNRPAQAESDIFVVWDRKTILAAYSGQRLIVNGEPTGPCIICVHEQYVGRTQQDLLNQQASTSGSTIIRDGLTEEQCDIHALACQALCADLKLKLRPNLTRHNGDHIMSYKRLQTSMNAFSGSKSSGYEGDASVPQTDDESEASNFGKWEHAFEDYALDENSQEDDLDFEDHYVAPEFAGAEEATTEEFVE